MRKGDWVLLAGGGFWTETEGVAPPIAILLAWRERRMLAGELRLEEKRLLIVLVMIGASMSLVKAKL